MSVASDVIYIPLHNNSIMLHSKHQQSIRSEKKLKIMNKC